MSPTATPCLMRAQGLAVRRGGRLVLDDVSVALHAGDAVGLLGRNGAGKSTLLESLLGFHPPSHGRVECFGRPVLQLRAADKQCIAYVAQADELVEGLSGQQQLALIASFHPRWDQALATRLAGQWALPLPRRIRQWSPGQRQRLAIVQALAARPQLLVADEPVASLDPLARAEFLVELAQLLRDRDCALLISSHIVSDLQPLVNRAWVLAEGRLLFDGPVGDGAADLVELFARTVG